MLCPVLSTCELWREEFVGQEGASLSYVILYLYYPGLNCPSPTESLSVSSFPVQKH